MFAGGGACLWNAFSTKICRRFISERKIREGGRLAYPPRTAGRPGFAHAMRDFLIAPGALAIPIPKGSPQRFWRRLGGAVGILDWIFAAKPGNLGCVRLFERGFGKFRRGGRTRYCVGPRVVECDNLHGLELRGVAQNLRAEFPAGRGATLCKRRVCPPFRKWVKQIPGAFRKLSSGNDGAARKFPCRAVYRPPNARLSVAGRCLQAACAISD